MGTQRSTSLERQCHRVTVNEDMIWYHYRIVSIIFTVTEAIKQQMYSHVRRGTWVRMRVLRWGVRIHGRKEKPTIASLEDSTSTK